MHDFGLVSIGSHTGYWLKNQLDRFSLKKSILIEPVPYNIIELKENVSKYQNVIIEESAISNKDEIVSFYFIKRASMSKLQKHWASAIGSFDKSHLLNHRSKRFLVSEGDIEEIKIECLSFESLIKKYAIKSIDRLMLDVEGSEFKILNTIDLKKINISEIFFEKKHFDGYMKQGNKFEKIKKKLIENQYEIKNADDENVLAVLKK